MLQDQIHAFFRDVRALAEQGRTHVQLQRQLSANRHADLDTMHEHVTALIGSEGVVRAPAMERVYRDHLRTMAHGRIMLRNHATHCDQLEAWIREIEAIAEDGLQGVVGSVLWELPLIGEFLERYVAIPSLNDVLMYGSAVMPNLAATWQTFEGDAVNFLSDLGSSAENAIGNAWNNLTRGWLNGYGDGGMTGGSSGANATQTHAQVAQMLNTPSQHLLNTADNLKSKKEHVEKIYSGPAGCQTETDHDYTLPDYPTSTDHSKADLTKRAAALHTTLTHDAPAAAYHEILQQLQGLSLRDAAALENIYSEQYSADLQYDILSKFPIPAPLLHYAVSQTFDPGRLSTIDHISAQPGPGPRIMMSPPMQIVTSGAEQPVTYTFDPGKHTGSYHVEEIITFPDGHQIVGGINPRFAFQFQQPGTYTISFGVWYGDKGPALSAPPMKWYSYAQEVLPPDQVAKTFLTNAAPPLNPQLYKYLLQAELKQAQAANNQNLATLIDEQIQNIDQYLGDGQPPATPIRSVLVDSKTGAQIPLLLYLVHTPSGQWKIVDLTNPDHPEWGDPSATIDGAWQSFMTSNRLPNGLIAGVPPTRPVGYTGPFPAPTHLWMSKNSNNNPWQNISQFFGGLSLVGFLVWLGLQFVPGVDVGVDLGLIGSLALGVSLTSGAIAGGTDLSDLSQHGKIDFHDPEVQLDILSIAGALAMGGAEVKVLGDGTQVVLVSVGKASFTTSTIILGQTYLDQIQKIQNAPSREYTADQKQQMISQILQSAAENGGLILIGGAATAFKGAPPLDGTWSPLVETLLDQLPADIRDQVDPRLAQALMTYFAHDGSDPSALDFKHLPPAELARMHSDMQTLYQQFITENPDETFSAWLLDDRLPGLGGLTRFESLRLKETLAAAQQSGSTTHDPRLLAALQNGQNISISVDSQGNLVYTMTDSTDIQAALINSGYDMDRLQKLYTDYVRQVQRGAIKSTNFADYVRHNNLSATLGSPGRAPVGTQIANFNNLSLLDRQLALLMTTEDGLVAAANTGTFIDNEKNPAVQDLVNTLIKNELLPDTVDASWSMNDARHALMEKFNDQLAKGLVDLYRAGKITFVDILDVISKLQNNRGSLGEHLLYYLYGAQGGNVSDLTAHVQYTLTPEDIKALKAQYPELANDPGLKTGQVSPDLIRLGNDAVDVKTYGPNTGIDEAQLVKYSRLLKPLGSLDHINYFVIPSDTAPGTGRTVATKIWRDIDGYDLQDKIFVYYVDENGTYWRLDPVSGQPQSVSNIRDVFTGTR